MRVLIIDDDKWYGESIANMLIDCDVVVANHPEDAIRTIDEKIPNIIYLDIGLGTKNGLTILNELQSWVDTRIVPIVLLSSDGKRLNHDDWKKYGVVKILDKSETTAEIINGSLEYGKFKD